MIEIGKVNNLTVNRETKSGFYLKDLESDEEVFMPPSMAPIKMSIGQELKAFVYLDTRGSLVATEQIPFAQVGEYALMSAIDITDFGAFFDWGIEKDLLVPGKEQKVEIKSYEDHIVRVCLEEETNRVYGTTKLGKYIEASDFDVCDNDKVKIVPVVKNDLGYRVIINKKFIGMIYDNEIFTPIQIGKTYDGVVKKIRTDCLIDAALQTQGILNVVEAKVKILELLGQYEGKLILNDKSSPEAIKEMLGMSKKTFKNAIGMLYKERKIIIKNDGIELVKN